MKTRSLPSHERLRCWRELRGISQAELGRRCGMPQYKICRIETGRTSVTADDLEVIASRGLGLSMAEFYGEAA